jgi:hypothetical protein
MIGVACNSQIPQANLHAVLDFVYLKVLKVSSVSVVQNEQSSPEITFVKLFTKVCFFLKHIAKGNRLPFAIAPKVI